MMLAVPACLPAVPRPPNTVRCCCLVRRPYYCEPAESINAMALEKVAKKTAVEDLVRSTANALAASELVRMRRILTIAMSTQPVRPPEHQWLTSSCLEFSFEELVGNSSITSLPFPFSGLWQLKYLVGLTRSSVIALFDRSFAT